MVLDSDYCLKTLIGYVLQAKATELDNLSCEGILLSSYNKTFSHRGVVWKTFIDINRSKVSNETTGVALKLPWESSEER